eukprot:Clim_evm4s91 gene=Clim_evmTU4s91
MSFKFAILAASVAIACAGPVDDDVDVTIPRIIREAIAMDSARFTSEAARQQFLVGDTSEADSTQFYIGKQTNFGDDKCTTATQVKNTGVICAVYRLQGDHKEIVLDKEIVLEGKITIAEKEHRLESRQGSNFYFYSWGIPDTPDLPEDDQSFDLEIKAERNKEPTYKVTKNFDDSLLAFQFEQTSWWPKMRIFWYRLGGAQPIANSEHRLWCGVIAEPNCG